MTTYKNIRKEVYQKIANTTNHNIKSIPPTFNEDSANCLKVSLVPIINNSLEELVDLNFNLSLAMEEEDRYLQAIQFRFRYDTDVLGPNVILNDVLNINLSENVPEGHYQLDVYDLQENVVEINLNATGSASILLDQFYQSILRLQLDASDLSAIPDFELINQGFRESISLINPVTNEEKKPDCITPEFPFLERTCPVITSISPDTVAAGVLGLSLNNIPGEITIRGSGFGTPNPGFRKPHESDVSFYDPDGGYFEAGELEYISWSDTEIRMNVPTRSKNINPNTGATQDFSLGASTNKIKIFTKNFNPNTGTCTDTCTVFSQDSLFVHFGMFNDAHTEQFQNIEICSTQFQNIIAVGGERRNLVNKNNIGGYTVFIDNFFSDTSAQNNIVSEIQEGLDFFRCNYKFNFTDQNSPASSEITRGQLPFATNSTTFMIANSLSSNCGLLPADNAINSFNIVINENVLDTVIIIDPTQPFPIRAKLSINPTFIADTIVMDTINNMVVQTILQDFRRVLIHEMGHVLQLRHTNNPEDIMAGPKNRTNFTRVPSANDILGIIHSKELSEKGTCINSGMTDFPNCTTSTYSHQKQIKSLQVFPNPTDSSVKIIPDTSTGSYTIYNILGEKIIENHFTNNNGIEIELSQTIQKGQLIIIVRNEDNSIIQTGTFIKI